MHGQDMFANEENASNSQKKDTWEGTLLIYLHDLVVMIAVVMLLFALLFRMVIVSGTSMNDTETQKQATLSLSRNSLLVKVLS